MPHEFSAFGVFFSPWLAACTAACVLASLTAWFLNLTKGSRFFRLHQWSFLAMLVLYAGLFFLWSV